MKLDQIWWLVSPQNPLKSAHGTAPLAERIASARAAANHPYIKVLDLETQMGTRYTIDTVRALRRFYPRTHFVWLMGADNLGQIRHWRDWLTIFALLPIAVLDRPTYSLKALAELPAQRYRRQRVKPEAAGSLADLPPPAWTFLPIPLDPSSATEIRAKANPS